MYTQAETTCQAHGKEIMGVEDSAKKQPKKRIHEFENASKRLVLFTINYCVS